MSPESQAFLDPSWFCSRSPSSSFHGLVLMPGISWPFLCFGLFVSSFLHLSFFSGFRWYFYWSSFPLVLSVFPVYVVVSPSLLGFPWFSWSFFPGLSWFSRSLLVLLIFSWSILVLLVSLVSTGHAYIFPVRAGLPWSCWSFLVCLVLSGPFWSEGYCTQALVSFWRLV